MISLGTFQVRQIIFVCNGATNSLHNAIEAAFGRVWLCVYKRYTSQEDLACVCDHGNYCMESVHHGDFANSIICDRNPYRRYAVTSPTCLQFGRLLLAACKRDNETFTHLLESLCINLLTCVILTKYLER